MTALLAALSATLPASASAAFGGLGALGTTIHAGTGEGEGEVEVKGEHALATDPKTGNFFVASRYQGGKPLRWFARLQEFGHQGEFLGDARVTLEPEVKLKGEPKEEPRGERFMIGGLAVDPAASGGERVYLLLVRERPEYEEGGFEIRNPEAPAAAMLWEFPTTPASGKLSGKEIVNETTFNAMGAETAGEKAKPLLFPRGLTVDPKTHDVLVAARQDESTEALEGEEEEEELERTVVQRVHPEGGVLGARYIDKEDCLGAHEVPAEPACEEGVEEFGSSPVVTPGGRVVVEGFGELWEFPATAGAGEGFKEVAIVPRYLFGLWEVEDLRVDILGTAPPTGESMSLVPSGSGGEGTLFLDARLFNAAEPNQELGVIDELHVSEADAKVSITETGWTGGQPPTSSQTDCKLSFASPISGASSEDVLALDLEEGALSVRRFGPGGEPCGAPPEVEPPAAEFGGQSNVTQVPAGEAVRLSSSLKGAYATSELWKFRYKEGSTWKEEAPVQTPYERRGVTLLEHSFAHAGENEVIETVNTDDLGYPQIMAETIRLQVLALPVVSSTAASSLSQTEAQLNATVNPDGTEVKTCTFEYGTSESYGSSAPCTTLPGSGNGPVPVSAKLSGLQPDTIYHYRISATNGVGTHKGGDQAFTTLANPPVVGTGAASSLSQTSAQLNASVNPNGGEVTACSFEYGSNESYGSSVPCTSPPGTGLIPVQVSAQLAGLQPGTTYHYRISATNDGGVSKGNDQTFTTQPKEASSGSTGGGTTSNSGGSSSNAGQGTLPFSEASLAPTLTNLAQSHATWRAPGGASSRAHKKQPPIGTVFSFTLNEAARVTLTFEQRLPGRKLAGKCVSQTSHNVHKPRCERTLNRGHITLAGHAGANQEPFQGRLGAGQKLAPGSYLVLVSAEAANGHSSGAKSLSFTIVT